ncbi:hypothetical protein Daus18300_005732 [Diaporthe australafricana]|uniref:Integral membrane protein n=1 Tax=Diaporthe australafricana TaxID=127596 RepID=A0ABR3WYZ0_9PEZI
MAPPQSPKPVKVTTFPLDSPRHIASYVFGTLLMLAISRRALIAPGSVIYNAVIKTPEAAQTAAKVQDWAFYFVVGAHAVEVPLFAALRLQKHGVPFFSALWWKWSAAVFLAGMGAWRHFGDTVAAAAGKRV